MDSAESTELEESRPVLSQYNRPQFPNSWSLGGRLSGHCQYMYSSGRAVGALARKGRRVEMGRSQGHVVSGGHAGERQGQVATWKRGGQRGWSMRGEASCQGSRLRPWPETVPSGGLHGRCPALPPVALGLGPRGLLPQGRPCWSPKAAE